ncbi:hypothetical protein DWU98_11980 [Dyella monticola]|uniref:Uncharacterized protein n=1 Tax=Dyella monticola TaxID=1927958 RepID=A0A370WYT2_9GAMM|nr:hypothetical protein [Dyella monticola]RDS81246.1 hypothetical protein DWU98_11980 [Dyella monticola]
MLFSSRRPTRPPTAKKHAHESITKASPAAAELRLHHLDYNLQPLSVASLSHYVEPVEDERFRVH